MQEATIVGMILMQETTNIVANVEDCPLGLQKHEFEDKIDTQKSRFFKAVFSVCAQTRIFPIDIYH